LLTRPLDVATIGAEIDAYDPVDAAEVSRIVQESASLEHQLDQLEAIFTEAINRFNRAPPTSEESRKALSTYLAHHLPRPADGEPSPRHMRLQARTSADQRISAIGVQLSASDHRIAAMGERLSVLDQRFCAAAEQMAMVDQRLSAAAEQMSAAAAAIDRRLSAIAGPPASRPAPAPLLSADLARCATKLARSGGETTKQAQPAESRPQHRRHLPPPPTVARPLSATPAPLYAAQPRT
jgi:hypothetical protein